MPAVMTWFKLHPRLYNTILLCNLNHGHFIKRIYIDLPILPSDELDRTKQSANSRVFMASETCQRNTMKLI